MNKQALDVTTKSIDAVTLVKPIAMVMSEKAGSAAFRPFGISPPPGLLEPIAPLPRSPPFLGSLRYQGEPLHFGNAYNEMWRSAGCQIGLGSPLFPLPHPVYASTAHNLSVLVDHPPLTSPRTVSLVQNLEGECGASWQPPVCGVPSAGSALHGSGSCNPCAWFWKPQGCENGVNCRRCHVCSPDEAKARKKSKQAALRRNSTLPSDAPTPCPAVGDP